MEKWTFQLFSASALKFNFAELFLAVLFGVSHHRVFSVLSGVNRVAPRGVGMVCRLFVISCVVMLGRFSVVAGGSIARIGMWEEPAYRKRDRSQMVPMPGATSASLFGVWNFLSNGA